MIETKDLSDRARKDLIGTCVANSQDPEALLATLGKIPGVISAIFG